MGHVKPRADIWVSPRRTQTQASSTFPLQEMQEAPLRHSAACTSGAGGAKSASVSNQNDELQRNLKLKDKYI